MNASHANPIITRLIGRPTWLTVRLSFWLTFGLGLISLFASSALMLSPFTLSPGWEIIFGWGVIILAPCLVTLLAVRATEGDLFTAADRASLSRLSPRQLFVGYLFGALYRVRGGLVLLVGLTPLLLIRMLHATLYVAAIFQTVIGCNLDQAYPCMHTVAQSSVSDWDLSALVLLVVMAAFLWLNVCAAAVGVIVALRWKGRNWSAMAISLGVIGSVVAVELFGCGLAIGPQTIHVALFVVALLPYVFTIGIFGLASRAQSATAKRAL